MRSPKELYEPQKYILSLGGKRLRPLLALISCDLFDKNPDLALDSALAVELFHNFSLIHDDILDNADLRRNKPTVHLKWNENIGILSGDAMLVKAFTILEKYPNNKFKKLMSLLNTTALDVCEGQQMDMNFESQKNVTVENYIHMISLKTAVLLACSLKMGAINAGASIANQDNLYKFGKHLGIAFQLLDDCLDAYPKDSRAFGKKVGGDILANKKTFLLLKTLELLNKKQAAALLKLLSLKSTNHSKKIQKVLAFYNEVNAKGYCEGEADKHTQIAIKHLNKVKANQAKKDLLTSFALQLLKRQA